MRSGHVGAGPAVRLWWTVPLGLALLTAVVFVAVVVPALAGRPGVPSQLVVHESPVAKPSASSTQSPSPRPTTTSASPAPPRSTTVVPAEQPVVRESDSEPGDDRGSASEEPRDR